MKLPWSPSSLQALIEPSPARAFSQQKLRWRGILVGSVGLGVCSFGSVWKVETTQVSSHPPLSVYVSTVKMLYKNPLFKNLSPYPGGIHQIQVASTLRTLGYPSFWSQVLNFWGLFPHQGKIESKTKFPNPPHQQTLCSGIKSICRPAMPQRSGCACALVALGCCFEPPWCHTG